MTLSEKIVKLRTGRGMSQGDLAEALEVSRQSVSKWETGQSVPDLERIVRMADLFGVTVDELVRDGERPEPPTAETQVIYVEREKHDPSSPLIVGAILEILGVVMLLLGAIWDPAFFIVALFPCLVGVMLLMVKRRPWFWAGWMTTALTFLIWNPWFSSVGFLWGPLSRLFSGRLDWTDGFALSRVLLLSFMVFRTYKTIQDQDRKSGS